MSKNVAVFVDVANIFYAAKAAGVDIDYVTLLKSASVGRDLVRAYAYTGLDPDNENQRNFHEFLRRHGYRVVSKDIRKYGDGKVKANLDIELVVDMMKTARNLDIAIVVSGDGDFAPAIRAVQEQGVRVEVISFRGNTSSDLIDVADQFTDITALAKVERDSSRSGRRVADDEHDLSMTEVPDKLTEGSGGRGRGGRGRGRGRTTEGTRRPAAAATAAETSTGGAPAEAAGGAGSVPRVRAPRATDEAAGPAAAASGGQLVALPGEKLSRAAASPRPLDEVELEDEGALAAFGPEREAAEPGEGTDAARRRRRRGGRGRGRGRGAEAPTLTERTEEDEDAEPAAFAPRPPSASAFGSIWDSQIGTPRQAEITGPALDDEDFEEPAIPEYLIAERRQRGAVAGRGGRGVGRGGRAGAYASFVDRERFGRGGGGGINRYPDVSGRERAGRSGGHGNRDAGRETGFQRQERPPRPATGEGGEPWSEVPPELEALLRAQMAARPRGTQAEPSPDETAARPGRGVAPGGGRERRPAAGAAQAERGTRQRAPAIDRAASDGPTTASERAAPAAAATGAGPARGRGRRGASAVTPAAAVGGPGPIPDVASPAEGGSESGARRRGGARSAAAAAAGEAAGPAGEGEGHAAAPSARGRARSGGRSEGAVAPVQEATPRSDSGGAPAAGLARRTRQPLQPAAEETGTAEPGRRSSRRGAAAGATEAPTGASEPRAPEPAASSAGARRRTTRKAADASEA